MSIQPMELVWPAAPYLPGYVHALQQGWSPDNQRPQAASEELERIVQDPARFLSEQVDREAKGPPVILPNGSTVPRLPGYSRWMWDGEFCGAINLRFVSGTEVLPAHVSGHVGYGVVPWKQRRGYATRALALVLPIGKATSKFSDLPDCDSQVVIHVVQIVDELAKLPDSADDMRILVNSIRRYDVRRNNSVLLKNG